MYSIKSLGHELYALKPEFLAEMVRELGAATGYAPTVAFSDEIVVEEYAAIRSEGKMVELFVVQEDGHPYCFSAGIMMPPSTTDTLKRCVSWFNTSIEALHDMNNNPDKSLLQVVADAMPDADMTKIVAALPQLLEEC